MNARDNVASIAGIAGMAATGLALWAVQPDVPPRIEAFYGLGVTIVACVAAVVTWAVVHKLRRKVRAANQFVDNPDGPNLRHLERGANPDLDLTGVLARVRADRHERGRRTHIVAADYRPDVYDLDDVLRSGRRTRPAPYPRRGDAA